MSGNHTSSESWKAGYRPRARLQRRVAHRAGDATDAAATSHSPRGSDSQARSTRRVGSAEPSSAMISSRSATLCLSTESIAGARKCSRLHVAMTTDTSELLRGVHVRPPSAPLGRPRGCGHRPRRIAARSHDATVARRNEHARVRGFPAAVTAPRAPAHRRRRGRGRREKARAHRAVAGEHAHRGNGGHDGVSPVAGASMSEKLLPSR